MLPIFSLWNAFSFSHKGTFLRWIRRCTANMRLTWAHSRLTGLRRQWAAGSSEFTAVFCIQESSRRCAPCRDRRRSRRLYVREKQPPNRLSLSVPAFSCLSVLTSAHLYRLVYPDLSGKHCVSGVFRDSLHLPLPQKSGLQ